MPFIVRYTDQVQGAITVPLVPSPTEIEYPERRLFKARTTKDGATVLQRPMRDSRLRRWVWKGYREHLSTYSSLWALLESLEVRTRWDAGYADVSVDIWENESGVGGFGQTTDGNAPDLVNYTNLRFVRVRFVQVNRVPRGGGGPTTYDTSTVEFVIDDTNYRDF